MHLSIWSNIKMFHSFAVQMSCCGGSRGLRETSLNDGRCSLPVEQGSAVHTTQISTCRQVKPQVFIYPHSLLFILRRFLSLPLLSMTSMTARVPLAYLWIVVNSDWLFSTGNSRIYHQMSTLNDLHCLILILYPVNQNLLFEIFNILSITVFRI